MGHTRAINIFEPTNVSKISIGDDNLRDEKEDFEERFGLNHYIANEINTALPDADGRHKIIDFKAGSGYYKTDDTVKLYAKDDSNDKAQLFCLDEDENEVQLIENGSISNGTKENTNGYIKLGNTIFQWGTGTAALYGGTIFTFPTAFLNASYAVSLSSRTSNLHKTHIAVTNLTTTTMTVMNGGLYAVTLYYMVIGK